MVPTGGEISNKLEINEIVPGIIELSCYVSIARLD